MSRGKLNGLKGQGSGGGAAIAVIAIIVVVLIVIFAFPQVLGGFGFGGTSQAVPIGVGPGTAGVVITSFIASPSIIEGGDSATFIMNVKNSSGIDAENVDYEIFGLGDSNSWSGESEIQSGVSELLHEDLARQIPGEETTQEWEATSEEKNTDITYPITGRVDYEYRTESDVLLVLYGRDNPNVKNTGITQSTISQVVTTVGPLTVTPKGTIPLIGKNTDEFRVSFDVVNVGGGRPYSGSKDTGLDRIKVSTDGCTLVGDDEVRLISNRRTISCTVDPSIDTKGQESKSLTVELEYNYIVEATTSIRVLKQVEQ